GVEALQRDAEPGRGGRGAGLRDGEGERTGRRGKEALDRTEWDTGRRGTWALFTRDAALRTRTGAPNRRPSRRSSWTPAADTPGFLRRRSSVSPLVGSNRTCASCWPTAWLSP